MQDGGPILRRRSVVTAIVVTAAGGLMLPKSVFAQTLDADTAPLLLDADVCVITPEVTEGPYYFDPQLVRADITEGRPGVPVVFRLQVVDQSCKPLEDARVDIWHCDASGLYSNYAGQGDDHAHPTSTEGETFLRGTQMADPRGIVEFTSIYPGWYRGRTTHVHFKVFLSDSNVLTGQIFFPDALSEYIYGNVAPYSDRGAERDTLNDGDGIAQSASRASFAAVKEEEDNYLVSLIIGVDPEATSAGFGFGPGGPGGPPPGGGMPPGGPGDPLEGPMGSGGRRGSVVPG
jgi:protocatechuate 3,4-dioxygenase beta subunit